MVTPIACLALAAAVLCVPAGGGGTRLSTMWPSPGGPRDRRSWAAAPAALGALVGLLVVGPAGAVAGAVIVHAAARRRRRRRTAESAVRAAEQLAEAVGRVTDELRSGSHPAAALGGTDADGPHARMLLGPAAAAARLGDGVAAALSSVALERPDVAADLRRLGAVWALAERYGIPLADLLAGAQSDIRWRLRFGNTVRAQLAGPRATASVLTALPVLGLGLGQLIGADPIGVLRGGVLGQALLVVGVALAAAGTAWTDQILRAAVPR